MDFNDEVIAKLDDALHEIFQKMNLDRFALTKTHEFAVSNMSLMAIRILRYVDESDEILLKEIRDRVNLPNSTLTSLVKKLVKEGLVEKYRSPYDGRGYVLKITEFGRKVNMQHRKHDLEIASNFFKGLNYDEKLAEEFAKLVHYGTRYSLSDFSVAKKDLKND